MQLTYDEGNTMPPSGLAAAGMAQMFRELMQLVLLSGNEELIADTKKLLARPAPRLRPRSTFVVDGDEGY